MESSIDFDSRPYNRSALRAACDNVVRRVSTNRKTQETSVIFSSFHPVPLNKNSSCATRATDATDQRATLLCKFTSTSTNSSTPTYFCQPQKVSIVNKNEQTSTPVISNSIKVLHPIEAASIGTSDILNLAPMDSSTYCSSVIKNTNGITERKYAMMTASMLFSTVIYTSTGHKLSAMILNKKEVLAAVVTVSLQFFSCRGEHFNFSQLKPQTNPKQLH